MKNITRPFVWLLLLLAGCVTPNAGKGPRDTTLLQPITPTEHEMEKCLPDGLRLATAFRREFQGQQTTVLDKLRELGAYSKDGKLFDRAGKGLYFYWVPDCGVWRTEEQMRAEADAERQHLRELERRYHVVTMHAVVRPC